MNAERALASLEESCAAMNGIAEGNEEGERAYSLKVIGYREEDLNLEGRKREEVIQCGTNVQWPHHMEPLNH